MYVLRCPGCGERVWIQQHREGSASFFCWTCQAHVPRWPGEPIAPTPGKELPPETGPHQTLPLRRAGRRTG
ncbi:MAG: hypothetical protein ACE14W_00820 [Candidatus Velamenicoccus archaeovorus]